MNKLILISLATVLAACAMGQGTMPMNGPKTQIVHPMAKQMTKHLVGGRIAVNPAMAIEHKFVALMLKEDASGLANLYSTNAIMYPPDHSEIHGRTAIRKELQGYFDMGKVTSFKYHDLHHRMSGNLWLSAGRVTMTMQPKDGSKPMTQDFRFTDVAEKIGGRWQITMDHASVPMMAPPDPMNYSAPMKRKAIHREH